MIQPNPAPMPDTETEPAQVPNPLAAVAPNLGKMTKTEKRAESLRALAALSALVDLAPDELAMRRIAREEADKIRPTRLSVSSPLGTRDLGEKILHPLFSPILRSCAAGVPPFIFGEAGCGKTTLAEMIADALDLPFYFTGAVQKPHQLIGYQDASGRTVRTPFREAFENGGLFLFDEVDASAPQALLTVNAALSNGWQDFPDGRIKAHPRFRFVASANTNGTGATRVYSGRNQLDGASLDRFAVFRMEADGAMTRRLIAALDFSEPSDRALALSWADAVDDYRAALAELDLRGIISPRAALLGARLIAAGFDFRDLAPALILERFASADDRERLEKAARVKIKERQERERAAATPAATA